MDVIFAVEAPEFKDGTVKTLGSFGFYTSYELAIRRLATAIHDLCAAENLTMVIGNGMVHPNNFEYIVTNEHGNKYAVYLEIVMYPLNIDCVSHFASPEIVNA